MNEVQQKESRESTSAMQIGSDSEPKVNLDAKLRATLEETESLKAFIFELVVSLLTFALRANCWELRQCTRLHQQAGRAEPAYQS